MYFGEGIGTNSAGEKEKKEERQNFIQKLFFPTPPFSPCEGRQPT